MKLNRPRPIALIILATVLALMPVWGQASPAGNPSAHAAGSELGTNAIVIRFRDSAQRGSRPSSDQQQLLTDEGATGAIESLGEPGIYRVVVGQGFNAAGVASALALKPDVVYAEPDQPIHLDDSVAHFSSSASATSTSTSNWALNDIQATEAWKLGTGSGVVVAVLDTGVSATHPDLANRVLPGWNFIQNDANASDDAGHGTFVAGLIAGSTQSGPTGVAPGASILPVKILDASGVGSTASFVAGINYAVNSGARIINVSASGASDSTALDDALSFAESRGVLVVASSGNDANEQNPYPAAISTVLAVSASDRDDKLAGFSSFGPYVDLAAPGVDISSSWWSLSGGDGHATASGSSASAPLVAGAAAIVAGLRPDASAATLREIITESAKDIESPGIDAKTGFGLLDAYTAAQIASPPTDAGNASFSTSGSGGGQHLIVNGSGFQPGEPLALWTSSSAGFKVQRSVTAGVGGSFSADLGSTWRYPQGDVSAYAVGLDSNHAVRAEYTITAVPASDPFKPVGPIQSTSDRTYFAATRHTLAYGFKQFWESHGGLAIFGYPISEEFSEKNADTGQTYTVQYFERNRFEYHPEFAGTPWEVSLGRLGVHVAPQTFPVAPGPAGPDSLYFDATHHTLSGPFRSYWESHGGLEMFGYPTSEELEQGGILVQYFERSRFEFHPELPAGSRVLLSRLGVELAREDGYLH